MISASLAPSLGELGKLSEMISEHVLALTLCDDSLPSFTHSPLLTHSLSSLRVYYNFWIHPEPGPRSPWSSLSYWDNTGPSKAASGMNLIANPIPSEDSYPSRRGRRGGGDKRNQKLSQHFLGKRNGQSDVLHKLEEQFHLTLRMFKGLGPHSTSRTPAIIWPVSWINDLSIKWMKSNEPEEQGSSPGSASDSLGSVLSTLQGSTRLSIQWRGCTRWLTRALAAQRFAGNFYELCREWEGLGIVFYSFPRKLCIFPMKGRIQITMAEIYWAPVMCHTLMSTTGKKKKKN